MLLFHRLKATEMTSLAYIHCRPDGTPFYVGKGTPERSVRTSYRNPYYKNIVNKYGKKNILKGFIECSSEQIALDLEQGIIKCFKRMGVKLTNMTDGGEGISGHRHTEETKRIIGEAARKAMTGYRASDEAKANMSRAATGRTHSDETKEKIRLIVTGRGKGIPTGPLPQSTRDKISVKGVERFSDPAVRENASSLTIDNVLKIKLLLSQGVLSQTIIAKECSVGQGTVSRIKQGLRWSHIILENKDV